MVQRWRTNNKYYKVSNVTIATNNKQPEEFPHLPLSNVLGERGVNRLEDAMRYHPIVRAVRSAVPFL